MLSICAASAASAVLIAGCGASVSDSVAPAMQSSASSSPVNASVTAAALPLLPEIGQQTVTSGQSRVNMASNASQSFSFSDSAITVTVTSASPGAGEDQGGVTVYRGSNAGSSTVVQPIKGGARFASIVSDPQGSTSAYTISAGTGTTPTVQSDQSVVVTFGSQVIGVVTPAWAFDQKTPTPPYPYGDDGQSTQMTLVGGDTNAAAQSFSPSGCRSTTDYPHHSGHAPGTDDVEGHTICNVPVPSPSVSAQLWATAWWGWNQIGIPGNKSKSNTTHVKATGWDTRHPTATYRGTSTSYSHEATGIHRCPGGESLHVRV